jgi:ELWxxDGT repeat protein
MTCKAIGPRRILFKKKLSKMKKNLLFFAVLLVATCGGKVHAQVIQMDNNHSLSGYPIGNKILLISDEDSTLWSSDGTAAGTNQYAFNVKTDGNGSGGFLNNKAYFAGIDATHGSELWVTDGTAGGTSLVQDMNSGTPSSTPDDFFLFNNDLYFTANTPALGRELYKLSGATGTVSLFKDINPGAGSGFSSGTNYYFNNNLMYFTANDGVNGNELWVTNGTGTPSLLANITAGSASTSFGMFSHIGNEVIFSVTTPTFSLDLWKTNGTAVGTSLVKSFNLVGSGFITGFLPFNNKLYFSGTDASGTELWSTDGTTTILVADINPGPGSSTPFLINSLIINNHFIFSATSDLSGNELWISDGVQGGSTVMLKDINPAAGEGSSPFLFPQINFGNLLNSGSISLGDIYDRTSLFNGVIFFSADDGTHGTELWKTDGTAAGTIMIRDIQSGAGGGLGSTSDYYYTTTGFYFSADNGTSGNEPWVTNGTSAGTSQVFDVNPGAGDSDPIFYFIENGNLYFSGDNGDSPDNFTDFYKITGTLSNLPVTLVGFTANPQLQSVQLNWTTSSEVNSGYFRVQRSSDGVHFADLAQVQASGSSSLEKKYGYEDKQAYEAGSVILFYRLQIVDKDGKYKYSDAIRVRLQEGLTDLKVYPNPVHDQLKILFSSGVSFRITDISGRQLLSRNFDSAGSSGFQIVNVTGLASGSYFLQMYTGKEIRTVKFVKE